MHMRGEVHALSIFSQTITVERVRNKGTYVSYNRIPTGFHIDPVRRVGYRNLLHLQCSDDILITLSMYELRM